MAIYINFLNGIWSFANKKAIPNKIGRLFDAFLNKFYDNKTAFTVSSILNESADDGASA
jgi:hypothetical protein